MKTSRDVTEQRAPRAPSPTLPCRNRSVRLLLMISSCMVIGHVGAQTCPQPTLLNPEFYEQVDTCLSTYSPELLCNEVFPAGPALAFQFSLAYPQPGYTLIVQPAYGVQFDPVIVVESQQCGASGNCPALVDSAGIGGEETFNFGNLDSGTYYLFVTSVDPTAPCGQIYIGFAYPYFDNTDGIFRAGGDY